MTKKYQADVRIYRQFYKENGVVHANTQIYASGDSPFELDEAAKIGAIAGMSNSLENKILNNGNPLIALPE